jgi:hypothetical protein
MTVSDGLASKPAAMIYGGLAPKPDAMVSPGCNTLATPGLAVVTPGSPIGS